MDHRHRPRDPRPRLAWTLMCRIASAIVVAASGGLILSAFSGRFDGHSRFRGRFKHLANVFPHANAGGVVGAATAGSDETGDPHIWRGMQDLEWEQTSGDGALVIPTSNCCCRRRTRTSYVLQNDKNLVRVDYLERAERLLWPL